MSEGLDIRHILPILSNRISEPVFLNYIAFAEICGAISFITFVFRILYMVRNMYRSECQALRDEKLSQLMDSIAELEKEIKEKREQEKRERSKKEKKKKKKNNNKCIEEENKNGNEQEVNETSNNDISEVEE